MIYPTASYRLFRMRRGRYCGRWRLNHFAAPAFFVNRQERQRERWDESL